MRKSLVRVRVAWLFFTVLSITTGCYQTKTSNVEQKANATVLSQPELITTATSTKVMPTAEQSGNRIEINGIGVWADHLKFADGKATIDLCFDLPDDGDWSFSSKLPFLIIGQEQSVLSGGYPIELYTFPKDGNQLVIKSDGKGSNTIETIPADETTKSWRCDQVYFNTDAQPGPVTLVVPGLMAQPREGQMCTEENLAKVQRFIDSKAAGVTVACSPDNNGISGMYSIGSLPAELKRESVEALFNGADLYDNAFGVFGPWEFQLEPE